MYHCPYESPLSLAAAGQLVVPQRLDAALMLINSVTMSSAPAQPTMKALAKHSGPNLMCRGESYRQGY